jgi:hypothetical protein
MASATIAGIDEEALKTQINNTIHYAIYMPLTELLPDFTRSLSSAGMDSKCEDPTRVLELALWRGRVGHAPERCCGQDAEQGGASRRHAA